MHLTTTLTTLTTLTLLTTLTHATPSCTINGVDFSSLTSSSGYTANDSHGYTYTFNICGSTSGPSPGMICQSQNNQQVAVIARWSNTSGTLHWSQSGSTYSLTAHNGEVCFPTQNKRTAVIQFTCDRDHKVGSLSVESTECNYAINFPTSLACGAPSSDCGAGDVDLSPLTVTSGQDYTAYENEYTYIMNVCGIAKGTSECADHDAGVCQMTRDARYVATIGRWNESTWKQNSDGSVTATLKGDMCFPNQVQRTAVVDFECDPGVKAGAVSISEASQPCVYSVKFPTKYACAPSHTCGANGHDFSSLNGTYKAASRGYAYVMSVCGDLDSSAPSGCSGSSICQLEAISGKYVATIAHWENATWTSTNNSVTASFDNGDACFPSSEPRRAHIDFVCDAITPAGSITVTTDSACDYAFEFPTYYACDGVANKEHLLKQLFASALH